MKKLSIFIIIAYILMFLSTIVYAVDEIKVNINMQEYAKIGDTIKIIVSMTDVKENNIKGLQGKIIYDTNTLEYVSNKVLANGWFVSGFNKDTGVFLVEVLDLTDKNSYSNGNSDIVEITFKVKENATLKDTDISISNIVVSGDNVTANKSVSKSIQILENTSNAEEQKNNSQKSEEKNITSNHIKTTESTENNEQKIPNKLPYTGSNIVASLGILSCLGIMIVSYIKYKKYKIIK